VFHHCDIIQLGALILSYYFK